MGEVPAPRVITASWFSPNGSWEQLGLNAGASNMSHRGSGWPGISGEAGEVLSIGQNGRELGALGARETRWGGHALGRAETPPRLGESAPCLFRQSGR